ncbi:Protein MMS22-like protein [Atta colombica]|uniref:Protein MMS22-like n=1 Tax=Atta colombica TaxID=520822 RepID=A0A195BNE2_9HYME|nr:Protein MMS22-like protein [Atta colombica]
MDLNATFDCSGKVNVNDWQLSRTGLFYHREVDNALFSQIDYPFSHVEVKLFDCVMPGAIAIMDLKHLINCMEMQLKILNRQEKPITISGSCNNDNVNYFSLRKMICEFIVYFRMYMNSIKWDLNALEIVMPEIGKDVDSLFDSLKHFLSTLHSIPDSTLHYAASNIGNKCNQSEFHLYHMHIELRWFFVTLMHSKTIWFQYHTQLEEFETIVEMIINDLLYSTLKIFERLALNWTIDLTQKTPYCCTCTRELWLMFQIFVDSLGERKKTKMFWDVVNNCIDRILTKNQSQAIFWHRSVDSSLPDCKNPELFCIWIIYHLSLLYGYSNDGVYLQSNSSRIKSNCEQVEKVLKTYVCKGGKDGERDELDVELKIIIPLLLDLIINWWQPRVPIISFLWDCFHKRLDQPFLLQTSGPWALSLEKKTATDILKQINDRIYGKFEHSKESSYGIFLHLIGIFLKKYGTSDPKYWNQIKGRVYTKFSKNKVAEFSESGLYNFISLFITLAITADTNVCITMLDLLPSTHELNNDYNKKCNLIWKGKLACLLLFNERKLSVGSIAGHFTETINLISCRKDETSRSMMINFVDVLNTILAGNEKMDLGEFNFIGGWIDRYLLECQKNRIGSLLEMIANVFEKCIILQVSCNNSDGARKMLDALWCFVASRVRQLVFDPVFTGDNYKIISKLAVIFTLEAVREPATAKKYKHSAASLFQHFAASIFVKDIRITLYYLTSILENEEAVQNLKKEIPNFDTILIQAWIKCSIVGYNVSKEDIRILQNYIINLNEIKEIFVSDYDIYEFKSSDEPILTFIISFMKKLNILKMNPACFVQSKNKLIQLNQPNDMLRTLINKIILVPENSTQSYIKQLGKKIFSMIMLGLEKLNVKSDILLQAMIRDIFDQYLPILIVEVNSGCSFKVTDTLLKCFKDIKNEFLRTIFEMLMSNFYNISSDNILHKHSNLITWLIKTLLKEGRKYPKYITEHIIQICSPSIFGCYMKVHDHHPHKLHTIDFINDIIKNPYYEEEKFQTAISTAVQKYLMTNTQFTFEFIRSILSIKKNIIINIFPQIEAIILYAEQYNRPNAASLRFMSNQLKKHMLNMDNNS